MCFKYSPRCYVHKDRSSIRRMYNDIAAAVSNSDNLGVENCVYRALLGTVNAELTQVSLHMMDSIRKGCTRLL